ncbi:MAG: glycosyltransferase family 39 protein [Chloroflexi bacterium]|nr:glycosyltransferase family 39 protein [Chloroflexota bacterium]
MLALFLKHKNQFWLYVALLVALALRAYRLDAQSLWNDEGTSVALSALSLDAIIAGAARDIHPPLYYFLLHFWMPFVGNTEYAVRFLSVIAGVVTVALVFRIAYSFFDVEVAIIAAYLSAFSPFQVYYSQETRMYVWVMLWAAVSVYAMLKILNSKFVIQNSKPELRIANFELRILNYELRIWILYIVATTAMLYTQYVGAFVVIAQNLAFAIWWVFAFRNSQFTIRHSLFAIRTWLIAQFFIGAFFLPWYLLAGGQLATWPSISEPLDLPTLLWRVLSVFSVGTTQDAATSGGIALAFGILFLVGWRRTHSAVVNWVTVSLILWTLVPVAVMYIVSLSRPAYNPKFLLLATPAFYILAARGLSLIYPGVFLHQRHVPSRSLLRWVAFVIAALAVAGPLTSLQTYFGDPRIARDDYRAVVQEVDAHARAGDGILIDAPGQIDVVRYYHRGDQQLYLLPRMRPPDTAATRADVDEMLAKSRRVFAIYYATEQSDPQNIIGARLAERAFEARDEWRGNIRLALYGSAPNPRAAAQSVNAQFGDEIVLTSYQLDQRVAHIGDVLTLTLNWRAHRTPTARYKVFAHLLDANNKVAAQRDAEPVNNLRLTTTWRAGENIADNIGIWLEPGMPPGEYRVEIGMYRADNGARLRVGDADHLILGTVKVQ